MWGYWGGGGGASSANVRVWGGGGASSVTDTCHHTVDSINISYYHWQELPQVSFLSCLSWQNTSFVMTKVLLPQQNFCCNKIIFVATKHICSDKTFITTKMILVAAPTNDVIQWMSLRILGGCFLCHWHLWHLWSHPHRHYLHGVLIGFRVTTGVSDRGSTPQYPHRHLLYDIIGGGGGIASSVTDT